MRELPVSVVRAGVRLLVVLIGVALALWFCAWLFRPDVTNRGPAHSPEEAEKAQQARDISFDLNHLPTLHRRISVTPKAQSPILEELEKEGKLPPLRERLPEEPVVLDPPDGIGKYGGTWMRLAISPDDVSIITYRLSSANLVRWSPLAYPVEPHIAKSVEPSPDKKEWTITLRKGLRWSDGDPYTADDIMYWWNCEINNKTISSLPPPWMQIGGKMGYVEKIDQFRVKFVFPEPYALFMEVLAQRGELCDVPAHYLSKYHPDPAIGDAKLIEREMKAYKMPSARALYSFMKNWQNPEHPRMWPWVYRSYRGNPPQSFVRNPYYYVVDMAGNQLPYIDRIQFDVQDSKLLSLSAANGGVSMQERHIRFYDYTELMSRRTIAGTEIYHWYPAVRSSWLIHPNQNRRVDPADPSTKFKAELLAKKEFKQALSLAIDRKRIIRSEQAGIGEPSQAEPGPESPFHNPKLAKAFVEYDPKRSNQMLDALGLTKRDGEGYRTFADGSRMTFYLDFTAFSGGGPAQFIVDDWAAVGIRTIIRERARPLFYAEKDAMDFDFNTWTSESDYLPLLQPRVFVPNDTESFYAVGWARWYQRGGFYGNPNANLPGSVPLKKGDPMYRSIELFELAKEEIDPAKQRAIMKEITDIAAENLWTISIATPPPALVVVNAGMRNVPKLALFGNSLASPGNTGIETYFFDRPQSSAGAIAETKSAILTPTLRPGKTAGGGESTVGTILRGMIILGVILAMGLLALRHPFIGRRLMIMVPTLGIISIVVFVIIQLPPGDYLTTRMMLLQESGDPSNVQAIEDMKQLFHSDDPQWKLYMRWSGLKWFTSFSPADEGLLQGNLGRSMETQQPINNMVGDRIMLTIVISLATIVFTWLIALPIGIYSAVRQYSYGDYALTLLGFVGMCIPAFLLALVLMAVSGVSGLFSPEFAAQPEWNSAKVMDLLKHVWIPIIVLGVGGTAGMIRVMRANLLDELKKPYVVTAMAKGVRPMKLLLKYPVRLALNPFVSGIGGLFPQLISGGAIVSMVLALPMVGPLLLQALFNEDMYLAGSMLMVLSVLGVIGTLVSDLLLLWLDPRIRFEGGGR